MIRTILRTKFPIKCQLSSFFLFASEHKKERYIDKIKKKKPQKFPEVEEYKPIRTGVEANENPEILNALNEHRIKAFRKENNVEPADKGLDIHIDGQPEENVHEDNYFDSLGYKRNELLTKPKHQKIRENESQFIDAYKKPGRKPKKLMTQAEIDAVHIEIDRRMQELEDTGLSREEIINAKTKRPGIPLAEDAVFQLAKNDRKVREMLINLDEEFSADNIIEKVLEQDAGPDPSVANPIKEYMRKEDLSMGAYYQYFL